MVLSLVISTSTPPCRRVAAILCLYVNCRNFYQFAFCSKFAIVFSESYYWANNIIHFLYLTSGRYCASNHLWSHVFYLLSRVPYNVKIVLLYIYIYETTPIYLADCFTLKFDRNLRTSSAANIFGNIQKLELKPSENWTLTQRIIVKTALYASL